MSDHRCENGMASTNAGSRLATGNGLMPQMRKPVASMMTPPTAEKSAIIAGVVMGRIQPAPNASTLDGKLRHADRGHRVAQRRGENAGSEEIQDGFDQQDLRVAGHALVHGAEDAGAAGAEQHQDGHELLDEFLLAQIALRGKHAFDHALGPGAEAADLPFQQEQLADDRAHDQRQHDGRQVLDLDDHRHAERHGSEPKGLRQGDAQAFGQFRAQEGAGESAHRHGGAVYVRSNQSQHGDFFLN